MRILAAEDDAVNLWVLRELLEQEGAIVHVCPDGQRALDMLATPQGFDVFLTDVRMPGITGYEAARRALALRPGLPVVGLSAYAMLEERQRWQEAGMVDYVTKPVDADKLAATLLRVTRRPLPPSAADAAVPALPAAPAADALVQWADLQTRLAHPDSRRQFLQTFVDSYRATPAALRQLLADGDHAALQRLAHKLHGTAGFLGAPATQQLAKQVEELARHAHTLPPAFVEQLAGMVERVLAEVAQHLQSGEYGP
jgi:CheY-like chemotaxis protein